MIRLDTGINLDATCNLQKDFLKRKGSHFIDYFILMRLGHDWHFWPCHAYLHYLCNQVSKESSPSTRRSAQVDQSSGFLQKLEFTVELDEFEGGTRAITWKRQELLMQRTPPNPDPHAFYSNNKLASSSANRMADSLKFISSYRFLLPNGRIYLFWSFRLWVSFPYLSL